MSSLPVEYSIAPAPLGRDPYGDRRPPWSEDAEQAVLAAMLIDQDAVMRAMEVVDDSMFYAERHRRLFRSMLSITERGSVVDPLTLADELQRRGDLEGAGGKDYIGFLVDAVPTSANVEYHARIVKEKALLRRLIEVSTEIVAEAFRGGNTADELLDTKLSIGKLRGTVHRYYGIPLVVTYHPAALLRNPAWKRPTWEDVQLARRVLDRAPGA